MFKSCTLSTIGKVAEKVIGHRSQAEVKEAKKHPCPCQLSLLLLLLKRKLKRQGHIHTWSLQLFPILTYPPLSTFLSLSISSQAHCSSSLFEDANTTRNEPACLQCFGYLKFIQTHIFSDCWRRGKQSKCRVVLSDWLFWVTNTLL